MLHRVSTLLALLLDIHVQRKATHLGKFTALQPLDSKSHTNLHSVSHTSLTSYGVSAETNPNPTARHTNHKTARGGKGYAALEEEFGYDDLDTGYRGAAGEMGRRSLGDR